MTPSLLSFQKNNMKINQSTEHRTFWTNNVNCFKSVQCLSKKKKEKKPIFFNRLLQSSGVVKHSCLNNQVSLTIDLLLVVHRGWTLLGIATGVLVACLDWPPRAGTVWNDLLSIGWGPWSFSGEAAIFRGLQGYKSLAGLWAIEWLSVPAKVSAVSTEDSPVFCVHVIVELSRAKRAQRSTMGEKMW